MERKSESNVCSGRGTARESRKRKWNISSILPVTVEIPHRPSRRSMKALE